MKQGVLNVRNLANLKIMNVFALKTIFIIGKKCNAVLQLRFVVIRYIFGVHPNLDASHVKNLEISAIKLKNVNAHRTMAII